MSLAEGPNARLAHTHGGRYCAGLPLQQPYRIMSSRLQVGMPMLTKCSAADKCLVAATAALTVTCAYAFKPADVSGSELAMLPPYCVDTEAFMHGPENSPNMSPRAPGWVAKMGRTFWAMHHYCWGLVNLERLKSGRADTSNKQYFARQIVDEYMYVINHATPDFVLLPEIWTRIGEASLLAGDVGDALTAYERARRIKPDYWPAYTQWAEFLVTIKKTQEAKELVGQGLRYAPNSRPMLDLYSRLGGDPTAISPSSAPAPAEKADGPEDAATSPRTQASH